MGYADFVRKQEEPLRHWYLEKFDYNLPEINYLDFPIDFIPYLDPFRSSCYMLVPGEGVGKAFFKELRKIYRRFAKKYKTLLEAKGIGVKEFIEEAPGEYKESDPRVLEFIAAQPKNTVIILPGYKWLFDSNNPTSTQRHLAHEFFHLFQISKGFLQKYPISCEGVAQLAQMGYMFTGQNPIRSQDELDREMEMEDILEKKRLKESPELSSSIIWGISEIGLEETLSEMDRRTKDFAGKRGDNITELDIFSHTLYIFNHKISDLLSENLHAAVQEKVTEELLEDELKEMMKS